MKTQDAVIRNFEIIGEAAKRLPDDIKSKFDGIEWAKLMGFRNVLIHDYFGAKLETVWNAIQEKKPNLETQTQKVLDEYTHVLVREDGN